MIKGPCFLTNAVTIKVTGKWWATTAVTCLVNNNSMILTVYLGYCPQKMILGEAEWAAVSKIIAFIAKWSEKSRSSELCLCLAFFWLVLFISAHNTHAFWMSFNSHLSSSITGLGILLLFDYLKHFAVTP